MPITLTSLYEIVLKEGSRLPERWHYELEEVEKILFQSNFAKLEKSNSQNISENGSIFECYCNHQQRQTIFITCSVEGMTLDFNEQSLLRKHNEFAAKLHIELVKAFPAYNVQRVPAIKRGSGIFQYTVFGDGTIKELDLEKIVFDAKSEFQRVTVAETKSNGKLLLLDWVEHLSDKDDNYTSVLCGLKRGLSYRGKTILILGCGNGAVLHQLKKLNPRMITMIEKDEMVLTACRTHMRSCCGDSLDQYDSENHKVIVGYCLEYLHKYANEGRQFDYVINNITEVPIETPLYAQTNGKESMTSRSKWQHIQEVFSQCLKVIAVDGQILSHMASDGNHKGIEQFEHCMKELGGKINVEVFNTYVSSFGEIWKFCCIRKSNSSTKD